MKQVFPTFIAKSVKDYLVYVPDLEIYTEGESFVDAIEMARDGIGLKGIDMENDQVELPEPSSAEEAMKKAQEDADDFDYSKGVLSFVDIDFAEYRRKMTVRQ